MSPEQCIAARALLEWSQADLEREAVVTMEDIIRFETNVSGVSPDVIASIETTLEYAGIDFIEPLETGAGDVKFRTPSHE